MHSTNDGKQVCSRRVEKERQGEKEDEEEEQEAEEELVAGEDFRKGVKGALHFVQEGLSVKGARPAEAGRRANTSHVWGIVTRADGARHSV